MTIECTSPHLDIEGELTIFTANPLRERLIAALAGEGDEIRMDLSRVDEVDSAGLQLLVATRLEAMARGKTLHLTQTSQAVADILEFCGLSGLFDLPGNPNRPGGSTA